jgi:hypothetical protein
VTPAPGRGWAALLASTLPEPELHNLATLGALAADVERAQLAAATALRPDVASVVVGINDTLRGDFDPERTGLSVDRTVAALCAAGAEVLTMRLVRRSRDLVPALMGLAVRERLGLGREEPEPEPQPEPEPESTEPKYPEPESTGLARVNLNVLSKPSGNLQPYEC